MAGDNSMRMATIPTIRITKEFNFEAAHFLPGYDGLCANIHGHSYRLFVTVKGQPEQAKTSPKLGMVMDFGLLKQIVQEQIVSRFDHSLVIRSDQAASLHALAERFRVVELGFQPTCENMLAWMADRLVAALPPSVTLVRLRLYETQKNYAEWYAEDNG